MIRKSESLRLKKTAEKILAEIKKAKRILLALHVSPDTDSVASTLAMDLVLRRMGKQTKIISFSKIPPGFSDISAVEEIEVTDFSQMDLTKFEVFIALDSADKLMITRHQFPRLPRKFKIINIDHHKTNTKFGKINLVGSFSSTAETLYRLWQFWPIKIDKKLAHLLFWGIFSDTGCFQYLNTSAATLRIAAGLRDKGADPAACVLRDFRSYSFNTLKYWGKILANLKTDESGKFIWSKISREECDELGVCPSEIAGAASLFLPVVKGTEFGIILNEETENLTRGSLRSRENFDVSKIAVLLGGGGHQGAAGFSLNLPLEEAEKKVLETVKRYVNCET